MSTENLTFDDVKNLLVKTVATEAGITPAELATDRPFTSYGLDSMAALTVGVEIEDTLGLTDLPVNLMWDHPTVDRLAAALWRRIEDTPVAAGAEGEE
ncbi:acyl carrier protein [Streptomyces xiamenensis]|jgi:acyl carrier protein|uniref:acyl carrier protein n=1 Tax=Streptomyces xiamenensis TaxID=408015 RepID=UPI0037D77595